MNVMFEPISLVESRVAFIDNFFTSHQLQSDLAEKNIRAWGTLRGWRSCRCPPEPVKSVEKNKRGTFDYKSDGRVLCVRWNDNKTVTCTTKFYDVNPRTKLRDGQRDLTRNQIHNLIQSRCINTEWTVLIPVTIFCPYTDRDFVLTSYEGFFLLMLWICW